MFISCYVYYKRQLLSNVLFDCFEPMLSVLSKRKLIDNYVFFHSSYRGDNIILCVRSLSPSYLDQVEGFISQDVNCYLKLNPVKFRRSFKVEKSLFMNFPSNYFETYILEDVNFIYGSLIINNDNFVQISNFTSLSLFILKDSFSNNSSIIESFLSFIFLLFDSFFSQNKIDEFKRMIYLLGNLLRLSTSQILSLMKSSISFVKEHRYELNSLFQKSSISSELVGISNNIFNYCDSNFHYCNGLFVVSNQISASPFIVLKTSLIVAVYFDLKLSDF